MPFKKYREHLIYKRLEKKVSTPPPSTSTSLQSVPLATTTAESTRINEDKIVHQNESPASSARSSPQHSVTSPRTLGSFFSTGSSGSNRRPLSSFLINDHHNDEYNAYSYGLVPLSERNIYREFSVIELPNNSLEKNNNINNNNTMMNTWSKKSTSTSTDYLHHHHHHLKVPNGSSNTLPTSHSVLKSSPPSTSSLHSTSNKGSSLEREKKTVRIVVEGESEGEGIKSSPETSNKNGQGSSPKPHFRSAFGKKWGGSGSSRGEVLIPIRREVANGGARSSSISSTGSGSGGKKLPSKSENHNGSLMAMEPVPTPVRSYKCTSYTLNEIRSF